MKRPYRTFYLYLILVGTLCSTPGWANAVGHCRIRILRQAQLQRDEVRLIDVAEVSTESEALQKQLEALVIARVSDGNGASTLGSEGAAGELSIGRYEIMRALAGMKISSGRVALYGASRCRVGGSVVEA